MTGAGTRDIMKSEAPVRTLTHARVTVQPALPRDEDAIGRVAYLTGFFGRSAETYFPDERLFRDLWVNPYYQTPHALKYVAARPGEQPLGYILGLTDGRAYPTALVRTLLTRVLPGLTRGRYARPHGAAPYLTRFLTRRGPQAPVSRYPAHLHINLLPEARGLGLGAALLDTYLEALRLHGVKGVQLSTTRENAAAIRLYEKSGFRVHAQRELDAWTPWLGRPAVHVVMTRELP